MRPNYNKPVFGVVIMLVFVLIQTSLPLRTAHAQGQGVEHLAVIQIIDNSGTMETNDPGDLRYTAAQLFTSLLDAGDAVGVLRFSGESTQITNGIQIITDTAQQTNLVESLTPVKANGQTDVKAAFEEAKKMKDAFARSGYKVVVIFLTDGQPEPGPNLTGSMEAYEQETLAVARGLGVPVLSVALTINGQTDFLTRLSSETGGRIILAKSSADLLDRYLQILGDLKDRTIIGTGSTASSPGETVLTLDPALMPYVDRVSFITTNQATVQTLLMDPAGQQIPADYPGLEFNIHAPLFSVQSFSGLAGGDWKFGMTGSGVVQARAILYSRLRARLVTSSGFFETTKPLPLVVKLVEEQPNKPEVTIIGEASFSAWITRPDNVEESLDRFYDDGTHGDVKAGDGQYTREYVNTDLPGIYNFTVRGSKGNVPFAYQTTLMGVALPHPTLDQPAQPSYTIRSESIPLQIHLEGVENNMLDSGDFEALVTPPSGATFRVALARQGTTFKGTYLPNQDGLHKITFAPVNAFYNSLAYTRTINAQFEARLVANIRVKNVQVGLQAPGVGLTRIEKSLALQSIPLQVTFESHSSQVEDVSAMIKGLSGFSLQEQAPLHVQPNRETVLTLHLLAGTDLKSQAYQGKLTLQPRQGVDLLGQEQAIAFEVFTPAVSITPKVNSQVSAKACYQWAPIQLVLEVKSSSVQAEKIQLHLEDLKGASLSQDQIMVAPGSSTLIVDILPTGGTFSAGKYIGRLLVDGLRPGLQLIGDSNNQLTFQVDPIWVTCRKPLIFLGVGSILGVIIFVSIIFRFLKGVPPPTVAGTLIYWRKDDPANTTSIDLTAFKKKEIRIGKDSHCEVMIPDEDLQDLHALISVERDENDELQYILSPKAKIQKGYRAIGDDVSLEENTPYQLGSHIFQFVRDISL